MAWWASVAHYTQFPCQITPLMRSCCTTRWKLLTTRGRPSENSPGCSSRVAAWWCAHSTRSVPGASGRSTRGCLRIISADCDWSVPCDWRTGSPSLVLSCRSRFVICHIACRSLLVKNHGSGATASKLRCAAGNFPSVVSISFLRSNRLTESVPIGRRRAGGHRSLRRLRIQN